MNLHRHPVAPLSLTQQRKADFFNDVEDDSVVGSEDRVRLKPSLPRSCRPSFAASQPLPQMGWPWHRAGEVSLHRISPLTRNVILQSWEDEPDAPEGPSDEAVADTPATSARTDSGIATPTKARSSLANPDIVMLC
jgi:hypothetical protein